jgi:hypothetical protein
METKINVYSGGDIAFTIGVDTNSNQPIPAAGEIVNIVSVIESSTTAKP